MCTKLESNIRLQSGSLQKRVPYNKYQVRFEVLTEVNMTDENERIRLFRNVGTHLPYNTKSCPIIQQTSSPLSAALLKKLDKLPEHLSQAELMQAALAGEFNEAKVALDQQIKDLFDKFNTP
jgi:hypothetical protein